jgi:ankyrin repeat protein
MDGGDAVDPYNTQLRETLRQTYLREKNAKERGQRYSAAAAEQITYHGKELHTRSPLRLAQPPGVGAHSLLVGSGADAGSSALDLHIGSGGGSGGDARQEYDAASSLDQKQHRPEINPADTSSSSYSSSSTAYQDKLRNPNPSSSLSEAQLRRRWKLSARVAWARNADTVDEAAEELRRSVNAYNFEKCVQLIQERMLQMQEQNEILAGKRGEVALRRAQGLPRLPSLVTVTTSTGETALTKACGERGQGAAVEVLIAVGLNVNATNHHGRTALMKASAAGQQIAVGLLLGSGADVFLKDKGGRTALDWSRLARQGHISAILESHVVKSIEKRRLVRYHAERNKDLRVVVQKNTAARERIAAATAANDMDKLWTALDALSGSVSKEQYLEVRGKSVGGCVMAEVTLFS